MNKRELIREIRVLKEIRPDEGFVTRTRSLVITARPTLRIIPTWVAGFALATILLALVASGIFLSARNPSISSSFNKEALAKEFNELDVNLQIDEVTYSRDIHETIASAITEISDSKISHLNPSILEEEQSYIEDIEGDGAQEKEINDLLEKVIN